MANWITRTIEKRVLDELAPGKVSVLLGPRRTGKTVLLRQLVDRLTRPVLSLNGEDFATRDLLARRSIAHYKNILGDVRILIIDEAQKVSDIGSILKLMVDEIEDLSILITGSSAFNMQTSTGEPLTGRKRTYYLLPLAETEYQQVEHPAERMEHLRSRLIYGNYPELLHLNGHDEKSRYLQELANDYLLKDILAFANIRNADKILALLRLIAFQIGAEVSLQELGRQLSMSKNTVERYLDLLTKVFVVFKVGGFSRNLRKEVTKNSKWYFYDTGLRNVLVANMNPVELRNDVGQLWENYAIGERLKYQRYKPMLVNSYFWRTYDRQEVDWIEDRGGRLYGYEMKWNPRKKPKAPVAWKKAYPEASFEVITPNNVFDWVSLPM